MSKTIKLSDFEYEQLIVILSNSNQQPVLFQTSSITSKVGEAWIKKLVLKLKTVGEETIHGN